MSRAAKIFSGLESGGAMAAGLMFFLMMLLVCLDVFMRYVLKDPFGWVVEVCEYMLLYVTFLGAPWLLRQDVHVRVDVVLHFASPRTQRWLKLGTNILGAAACAALFVFSCVSTWDAYTRGTPEIKTLHLPKWTLLWVIPYGSLMLALEFLRQAYRQMSSGVESDAADVTRTRE